MASEEDFLTRWSRRKAEARRPPEPETSEVTEAAEIRTEPGPPEPPPELPDPETMEAGSDFRAFMADGVPPALRRRALRRLWRVNPIINAVDGLDDYYVTQDFTDAATVVPDLKSIYRVGREVVAAAERLERSPPDREQERPEAPKPAPAIATGADQQIQAEEPQQAIVSDLEPL